LKGWECERCGHTWVPRDEDQPRVCPKCKSPYWDKPRKVDLVKSEVEQAREAMRLKKKRGSL
jgi:NADH pyrophosphatase NudC (nudix superfamily)